jgi:hypothetical protein
VVFFFLRCGFLEALVLVLDFSPIKQPRYLSHCCFDRLHSVVLMEGEGGGYPLILPTFWGRLQLNIRSTTVEE